MSGRINEFDPWSYKPSSGDKAIIPWAPSIQSLASPFAVYIIAVYPFPLIFPKGNCVSFQISLYILLYSSNSYFSNLFSLSSKLKGWINKLP